MDRIKLLTKEEAPAGSKETLSNIEGKMGKVINIFKAMSNSPAVLKNYFAINDALAEKTIDNATAERIAIRIAAINECPYCLAAHSYLAKSLLSEEEIKTVRKEKSSDKKAQAALDFSEKIMKNAGKVSDEEFEAIKSAGYKDGEILEIAAIVALNFFTNLVNNISQTKVNFPKPQE